MSANPSREQSDCYLAATSLETSQARLEAVSASFRALSDYRAFLKQARKECANKNGATRLSALAADKAFAAERHTRVICHHALETLNELRDGGMLQVAITSVARDFKGEDAKATTKRFAEAVQSVKQQLAKVMPSVDSAFLDEFFGHAERLKLGITNTAGGLHVKLTGSDNKEKSFVVEPTARPGMSGRISSDAFFAKSQQMGIVVSAGTPYAPADCHHRDQALPGQRSAAPLDVYGSTVAGLAFARDAMYRHARKTDELGLTVYEGDDPITAILVGLLIVGAIALIAGVVITIGCATDAFSGDVCDFGLFLIVGGAIVAGGAICVLAGACAFVLGTVVVVAP